MKLKAKAMTKKTSMKTKKPRKTSLQPILKTNNRPGRCAIAADCHIGPRAIAAGTIWEQWIVAKRMLFTFYEFMIWCEEHQIKTPIIAGDFFDTRLIPPRLVGEINLQLRQYSNRGIRPVFINGNHEEDKWSGTALDYLNATYCTTITTPGVHLTSDGMFILVAPFVYGLSAEEVLDKALEQLSYHYDPDVVRLLVGHFGLYSDGAALWEQNDRLSLHVNHVKKRLAGTNIRVVAVGHYHNYSHYELDDLDLYQIGALSPRNFGETGAAYGNILEVDGLHHESTDLGATHYLGACAGVRYIGSADQFRGHYISELELEPMRRCWYITRRAITSFPVTVPIVPEPKRIDDVQGGAFTFADYSKNPTPYYDTDDIGPRGLSAQRSIHQFVERQMAERNFNGPLPGLASEAVNRTQGAEGAVLVTAPQLENPVPWKLP